MKFTRIALASLFVIFIAGACNQKTNNTKEGAVVRSLEVELDTSAQMLKIDNTLFSLPSPYQLSLLIKTVGGTYNQELLNPIDNLSNYTTTFKKAINLGVYGADLAYANIYEQTPIGIKYFSTLKVLSEDLGLSSALDANTTDRIEQNIENQDSLLYILSNAYHDVDLFLKENQRKREGALVLAGGWIEGMYFITNMAIETKNEELKERIGENRQPLENLIKILSPYYSESSQMSTLVDDLLSLAYDFDRVKSEYTYVEPSVDVSKNLTHVHSINKVVLSNELLLTINKKIGEIRSMIIG